MGSFLVLYGTGEGQTAAVSERIAGVIGGRGHDVETVDVETVDAEGELLEGYDAVLVGSSIHVGSHHPEIVAFAREHRERLEERPTAFFQLSLSSAVDDERRRAEAARYVEEFLAETGWEPDRLARFGGALRYSEYGFLKRIVMKRIAKRATGDTDSSRDYEYTDWAEVEAFAADVAAFVEKRLGVDPPADAG